MSNNSFVVPAFPGASLIDWLSIVSPTWALKLMENQVNTLMNGDCPRQYADRRAQASIEQYWITNPGPLVFRREIRWKGIAHLH